MTCYPEFPQAVPIRNTKQLECLRGAFKDFTSGLNEGGDERNEECSPLLTLRVRAALLYSCVCLTTPTTKSQSPLKNKVCLSATRRYLPVSPGRWASCMGLLSSERALCSWRWCLRLSLPLRLGLSPRVQASLTCSRAQSSSDGARRAPSIKPTRAQPTRRPAHTNCDVSSEDRASLSCLENQEVLGRSRRRLLV